QAVPNLPVYVNIARVFYQIGLNGTVLGVVLVHAAHGLVLAVWIASAAFASVDVSLEEAARNIGASPWTCFRTVTLPLAAPGLIVSADFRRHRFRWSHFPSHCNSYMFGRRRGRGRCIRGKRFRRCRACRAALRRRASSFRIRSTDWSNEWDC